MITHAYTCTHVCHAHEETSDKAFSLGPVVMWQVLPQCPKDQSQICSAHLEA